ncbi:TPA: hypothetical protein N2E47_001238 [Salmonella enterica]|nr:hypothetical protein [Salmonella enterica]
MSSLTTASGASVGSASTPVSVVCVDAGNMIDFSSQSFASGLFIPLFFFCLGMGISAIMSVLRSL